MRRFLIVVVGCCVAVPGCQKAQTAEEYLNRAEAWNEEGEYDKAIGAYAQALAVANPKDHKDKETIIKAYNGRAYAWEAKGERDKAIADYSEALAIDAKSAHAYVSRGYFWTRKGNYDKAIADYSQVLTIDPKNAGAYDCRGSAWQHKGEYDKAVADYTKAVEIYPNDTSARADLARIYATCPDAKYRDGKKAVENASKAYQLPGGKDYSCLGTLAAAYAESGDFTKALVFQGKAIESASEEDKPAMRSRLELYKQDKPFHEPPVKK